LSDPIPFRAPSANLVVSLTKKGHKSTVYVRRERMIEGFYKAVKNVSISVSMGSATKALEGWETRLAGDNSF
jgi:hypothetical protein